MSIQRAEADLTKARLEAQQFEARAKEAREKVRELEIFLEVARRYEIADATQTKQQSNGHTQSHHAPSILDVSVQILEELGKRQTTRQLLEHLERKGRSVGGVNKAANLASILSKSDLVNTNKVEGWGLNAWDTKPPEVLVEVPGEELPF